MKNTHNFRMPDQSIKVLIDSAPNTHEPLSSAADTSLHYYCLAFMYGNNARGSIYVGLLEEKITTHAIATAKNKMLKNYEADPNTTVLTSASYLGFMKPSEFAPDNWSGGLLE